VTDASPGSLRELQLVVYDLDEARRTLIDRGAAVSEIFHDATGAFHHAGTAQRVQGPHPERADFGGSFASFADPDGNGSLPQQIRTRLPGR
jgi:hypothetical protein